MEYPLPSIDDVKRGQNIFKNVTDDEVNSAIDDGKKHAINDNIGTDGFKSAVKWFARYVLYIDWYMGNGGINSASTFGNSQSITDKTQNNAYLDRYNQIADEYGASDWHMDVY